ncbi:hypothetical protein KM043_013775 [Ampulex compressa]|nr:hypothetical protein KM043_013775 [Ampulex compressa]
MEPRAKRQEASGVMGGGEGSKGRMSQRLIKSSGAEDSLREGTLRCSRAWEKASRFIDCGALQLARPALLPSLYPIVPLSSTEDRHTRAFLTCVSSGKSLFPSRDMSTPRD